MLIPKPLYQRWQSWLQRRFTLTHQKKLGQRDILVFFNREGYLYLILLVISFIAGTNYANNLILALSFLLSSLMVMSFYLAFRQLYGLQVSYQVAELGQVGQALTVKFHFTPAQGQLYFHLRCEYANQYKKITSLKAPLSLTFQLTPEQRGKYSLPKFYFYSVYPFGIIKAWSLVYPTQTVWIAPKPLVVQQQFGNLSHHNSQAGIADFSHIHAYRAGDKLNRIAWAQYAKGRGLVSKQFEEPLQHAQHFVYQNMPAPHHEDKLSQLMYLIDHAQQQQQPFSLTLPSRTLPLRQGDAHFYQAKLALAQEA